MYLGDFTRSQASSARLRNRIQQRGETIKGHKLFAKHEDDICRADYPDYDAMVKHLPHRTRRALKARCCRLGICKPLKQWTAAKDMLFRKVYRKGSMEEILEAFPDMTRTTIYSRGGYHKIHRPRKPYLPTGIALLDELRDECFRHNITLADLDEIAKSRCYFKHKLWRAKRPNYNHIVRGIYEMGGKISVHWERDQ